MFLFFLLTELQFAEFFSLSFDLLAKSAGSSSVMFLPEDNRTKYGRTPRHISTNHTELVLSEADLPDTMRAVEISVPANARSRL